MNGLNAEVGSGAYNLSTLVPDNNAVLNFYLVAMTLSNMLALAAGIWFLVLPTWPGTPVPLFFQITYGLICLILVIFRQAHAIQRYTWLIAEKIKLAPVSKDQGQREAPGAHAHV